MQNQNQNQKEIKFVFRIDSQFAADAAAAAEGLLGDVVEKRGPRGHSFCVLPGQLLAFFNVFLNKEFNKHLGGPRTTTRPARAQVGPTSTTTTT